LSKFRDGQGDGTGEIREFSENKVLEVGKVADGSGDLAGEVSGEDGEGDDAVGDGVAVDLVPIAAVVG